jgi:glycosyltransferase involved in cell wall biosynthesis
MPAQSTERAVPMEPANKAPGIFSVRGGFASTDLISIIVITYDNAKALDAVLRALAHQSDRNFEIVVADDGSGPDTARVVAGWASRLPMPIKHVWQPHNGFRGGEIRNRAIRASVGRYCIFLDGDCLTRADFVAAHRRLAEAGSFVTGNRMLISRQLTEAVLAGGLAMEAWSLSRFLRERLRGKVNRMLPLLRAPLGPLRRLCRNAWRGAKTCNMSVARSDLDFIDGFDTSYTGWGLEDTDLVVRLLHAGVRRKDGRFATGVLHLWHSDFDRKDLRDNERRLREVLTSKRIQARQGLSMLRDDVKAQATMP